MTIVLPFRGQIWWADLNPTRGHEQQGQRPCLVVSVNGFNHGRSELLLVVPLTRTDRRIPSHDKITSPESGLDGPGFALCEQVRCISRNRLTKSAGHVSPEEMAAVEQCIRLILGL